MVNPLTSARWRRAATLPDNKELRLLFRLPFRQAALLSAGQLGRNAEASCNLSFSVIVWRLLLYVPQAAAGMRLAIAPSVLLPTLRRRRT
jgi:hypothetical protein